jgi:hypothetical protein
MSSSTDYLEFTVTNLTYMSVEDIRKLMGACGKELRNRKAVAEGKPVPAPKQAAAPKVAKPVKAADPVKVAAKQASKDAYLAKKAAFAALTVGIKCIDTGKVLKRRFADTETAATHCAELALLMKRSYIPCDLTQVQ